MSWLSELADKAETLLNKIDSEAATVLSKEQEKNSKSSSSNQVSSFQALQKGSSLSSSSSVPSNLSSFGDFHLNHSTSARGSGSLTASPTKTNRSLNSKSKDANDKYLMDLLNSDMETDNLLNKSTNYESLSTDHKSHSRQSSLSSGSSFLAVSDRETPGFTALDMESSGGSLNTDQYVTVDQPLAEVESFASFGSHSNEGSETGSSKNHGEEAMEGKRSFLEGKMQSSRECGMLRKEIASLNQEMSQVHRRAKEADKETHRVKSQLTALSTQLRESQNIIKDCHKREENFQNMLKRKEACLLEHSSTIDSLEKKLHERDASLKQVHEQNQRLLTGATLTNNLHSEAVTTLQEKVKDLDGQLEREKQAHSASREEFSQKITQFEEEQKLLSKELSEAQKKHQDEKTKLTNLNSQITSLKYELSSVRDELTDYKEKASRILQSKDKLILSLKEGNLGDQLQGEGTVRESSELLHEELEQLRGEKNLLMEEVERAGERIKQLTAELSEAEIIAQQESSTSSKQLLQLQEELESQKSEATLNQEELRQTQQEMRSVKEELSRQKVSISTRLQERDYEIEKLQRQIAHRQSSTSSTSELETRIHGLTESLIHKQNSIEALSNDKHSLQIQLEKLQQLYQESQNMLNMDHVTEISHDEGRSRVPTFLLESPFDGGVTRRVKKAYGTLDKFSIRLGKFLRRYPIARVFVLLYMGLLHAWVMIVLLTYSPEIHGPDFIHTGREGVAVIPPEG